MRVMGIDPGLSVTGYGIIEAKGDHLIHLYHGIINTRDKNSFSQKIRNIYEGLSEVIRKFSPEAVAIENLFFARNPKNILQLGQAQGVAILAAINQSLKIHDYSVLEIKQSVVGYGRASKEQVQQMVKNLLKLKETIASDASDALAVAICHIHSAKLKDKLQLTSLSRCEYGTYRK